MRLTFTIIAVLLAGIGPASAQDLELARIEHTEFERVESKLFELDSETQVGIKVLALRDSTYGPIPDVWILDSETRDVVWDLDEADETKRRRHTVALESVTRLPAGLYEVYSSTFSSSSENLGFGEWVASLLRDWFDYDDDEEDLEKIEVVVSGRGSAIGANFPQRVGEILSEGAFVAFTGVGDDAAYSQGFRLAEDTEIRVYALGEATKNGSVDTAWIVDASTREPVWRLEYWDSSRAGGAKKNRVVDELIRLPAGTYAAFYATDDSHSCRHFNATPPRDPFAWGLTLRASDPDAAAAISLVDFVDPLDRNVIVSLTRLGDYELESRAFTLGQPQEVLIYALGEGDDGSLYDYGWIIDANTREAVWTMEPGRTEHAGGAEKNRLVQEEISLPAGSYIAHFRTDGSHSYDGWNSSPPIDRERWGMTIVALSPDMAGVSVSTLAEFPDSGLLAHISEVRDRDREEKRFSLERESRVVVYALGEGSGGDMDDYGWIVDADSGETVWEMRFKNTERAGGARKNRRTREVLTLPAGEYELHYRADGSHAFGDWNAAPPDDPTGWGIRVSLAD